MLGDISDEEEPRNQATATKAGNRPMQRKTILTAGPSITSREIDYVIDAVNHGWNQNWNSYLLRFEQAFAKAIGTRFASEHLELHWRHALWLYLPWAWGRATR